MINTFFQICKCDSFSSTHWYVKLQHVANLPILQNQYVKFNIVVNLTLMQNQYVKF